VKHFLELHLFINAHELSFYVSSVDILKRQTPIQLFNWSERCLTCRHLQKTSREQTDDQFNISRETNQKLKPCWSSEADNRPNTAFWG